jgi:transcriptional regulator with XRE-family HTH domain
MYAVDGGRLRAAREAALLSQRELAEAAGITQSTLSRLEMGKQTARGKTVRALAIALKVDSAQLLAREHSDGDQAERRSPSEEPHR